MSPLAIDLFCGLGGWTEGLLEEGYYVIGFDIERHQYGEHKYPAQLVIQDVLTIHGSQFKNARLIVASPPCQEFSYMAMPWSLAKEKQRRIEADTAEQKRLTALFDACFRIQREAEEAAGRHIPLVVENVRGAQKWVGRAKWNFGSFYLWGDVPALMPIPVTRRMKSKISCAPRLFSERVASTPEEAHATPDEMTKHGFRVSEDGVKGFTPNGEPLGKNVLGRKHGSKSKARKRGDRQDSTTAIKLHRKGLQMTKGLKYVIPK